MFIGVETHQLVWPAIQNFYCIDNVIANIASNIDVSIVNTVVSNHFGQMVQ